MRSRITTILTLVALVGGTGIAIAAGESGSSASGRGDASTAQYKPGKGCGKPSQHQRGNQCKPKKGHHGHHGSKSGLQGQSNSRSVVVTGTPSTSVSTPGPTSAAACVIAPPVAGQSGSTNGKTITLAMTCSAVPGTLTIKIDKPPKTAAEAANPTVLAHGIFTISTTGPQNLTMRLTSAGKGFFTGQPGTVHLFTVQIAETFNGVTTTVTETVPLKIV